jgi:hypothetical protein
MASSILANRPSKLNLSRRQAALFQRIILSGNKMAETLNHFDSMYTLPKSALRPSRQWSHLMVQLAKTLL